MIDGNILQTSQRSFDLKGQYHGDFDLFWSKRASLHFLIYKIILEQQDKKKKSTKFLKEEQIMICSSAFWKRKCEKLKKS